MRFAVLMLGAVAAQAAVTPEQAAQLAELPLKCIGQEYPNKTGHTQEADGDARLTPRQLHPSFYGCFDWHSSVHGHWMLVRLLRDFALPNAARVRAVLEASFAAAPLREEAAYFTRYKLARIFERTYGWAWLLKLDQELAEWPDADAARWRRNLAPVVTEVARLWKEFLPKQTYPNRTGVHPNTAFGLVFALDWARKTGDTAFTQLIEARARDYYWNTTAITAVQEPDGTDFLSPSLEVADLMRRVLPAAEFRGWFDRYLDSRGLDNLLKPPVVSDRSDYMIVHLDGLSFSRAWCLRGIAQALPRSHPVRARLGRSAADLVARTLPHLASGYGGEHWLATFAVYATLAM